MGHADAALQSTYYGDYRDIQSDSDQDQASQNGDRSRSPRRDGGGLQTPVLPPLGVPLTPPSPVHHGGGLVTPDLPPLNAPFTPPGPPPMTPRPAPATPEELRPFMTPWVRNMVPRTPPSPPRRGSRRVPGPTTPTELLMGLYLQPQKTPEMQ